MSGGPEDNRSAAEPPAGPPSGEAASRLRDVSISDRWAPLVRDPDKPPPQPPKLGRRLAAAALSLIVLTLVLWALA